MKDAQLGLLPAIPITKVDSPEILRVLAQEKIETKDSEKNHNDKNKSKVALIKNVDRSNLNSISKYSIDRINAIDQMMEAHPDLELASQTLVASILSPNDLLKTNLFFSANVSYLTTQVIYTLNSFIQKEMKQYHGLEDDLYQIVMESYVTKGAYAKLFIPENKLHDMLDLATGSVESVINSQSKRVTGNAFVKNAVGDFSVSSDPTILIVAKEMNSLIGSVDVASTEAIGDVVSKKKKQKDIENIFKTFSKKNKEDVIDITSHTTSDARGLVMKIPVESIIPLHFTNDPSAHFGYYIILDGKGSPTNGVQNNNDDKLDNNIAINKLVAKAKTNLKNSNAKAPHLTDNDSALANAINDKIIKSIENNIGGSYITDDDKETLLRVVLHRTLNNLQTRLLYVPSSQLSYYAFNFRSNGTGKPILDGLSTISSLRTMLRFSKISALIRNSIPNTEVSVTLDDNDPDAPKTMESIKSYVMNTRSLSLPIGITKTSDVVDWLHKYGFNFNFKHADLPDMEINSDEKSVNHTLPDSDAEDELKRMMYMKMGLSPEMVENTTDADFAATVVANNVLQAKRISRLQVIINKLITSDVIRYIRNDGYMSSQVKHVIASNKDSIYENMGDKFRDAMTNKNIKNEDLVDFLYESYLNGLEVTLPKVEINEDGSKEAFDNYKDSLEDYIEAFFSSDSLPEEYSGPISDNIDMLQQAIKNTLLRRWMNENGYMSELASVFEMNDTGDIDSSVLNEYNVYINNISSSIAAFVEENESIKAKNAPADDNSTITTDEDTV